VTSFGNNVEKQRFRTVHEVKGLDVLLARPVPIKLGPGRESDQRGSGALNLSTEKLTDGEFPSVDPDLCSAFDLKIILDRVPLLTRNPLRGASGSVFEADPTGFAAEQFRLMQRRLTNVRPEGGSVLLTSPGACDGKSLNTHNLAWALAEAKQSTLLLELDLRRPTQMKYFGAQLTESVVNVLSGEISPAVAVRRLDGLPLCLLGLSTPAENPITLLRSDALQRLIGWARRNFRWVLIDAPPILPVADLEELLPSADLVLMVVRERVTPRVMVERAADRLGKRLDYLILNDVTVSPANGYGYDYN